jgi:hypothetical protein
MDKSEYLRQLVLFSSGASDLEVFQEYVEGELAALREDRRPSKDKAQLSKLELVLHEVREGARERFDAYALALTMLQRALDVPCPPESGASEPSSNVVWSHVPGMGPATFGWEAKADEPTRCDLPLAEAKS